MSDLNRLEEELTDLLFQRARILEELIALAFVDVYDYIVINTVIEDGKEKQIISLHPDINEMDVRGIEILQGEDGLTVRAPHTMKALEILLRYFNELEKDDSEISLRSRIETEREKVKKVLAQGQITES